MEKITLIINSLKFPFEKKSMIIAMSQPSCDESN